MKHNVKTILPAGKYYIGDPCYVIGHEDHSRWSRFCDILFKTPDDCMREFEGTQMFAAGTAFGDGCYDSTLGIGFGVDAGLIGAVPIELTDQDIPTSELKRLGTIVTFEEDFVAERDEDGTFYFGDIKIWTGDTEEDEEEEDA